MVLIVVLAMVNALRLEIASQLLNEILPNIVVAVTVVMVGLYAATFVGGLVRTAGANG